jgi:hypothetical protein
VCKAKQTPFSAGRLLRELVSSPFFALVYHDSHFDFVEGSERIAKDFNAAKTSAIVNNPFVDKAGAALLIPVRLIRPFVFWQY